MLGWSKLLAAPAPTFTLAHSQISECCVCYITTLVYNLCSSAQITCLLYVMLTQGQMRDSGQLGPALCVQFTIVCLRLTFALQERCCSNVHKISNLYLSQNRYTKSCYERFLKSTSIVVQATGSQVGNSFTEY